MIAELTWEKEAPERGPNGEDNRIPFDRKIEVHDNFTDPPRRRTWEAFVWYFLKQKLLFVHTRVNFQIKSG